MAELIADSLILDMLTVGPFQVNVFVVGCPETNRGVIVDAGGDAAGLIAKAKDSDLALEAIWQTHAHIDHVAAITDVRERLPDLPILLHRDELPLYDGVVTQGAMFGMPIAPLPPPDRYIEEGDVLEIGELRAQVLVMPGHSPGSVIFYFEEQAVMLSGDVLFAGSMGRIDLPGANPDAMRRSLARLKTYPDDVRIFCGHGPATVLGAEKARNPFLTQDW